MPPEDQQHRGESDGAGGRSLQPGTGKVEVKESAGVVGTDRWIPQGGM